ncbi:MAG: type I-C CRISPR-associated protein Cas8c/Csd1 [Desulfovibrio sp.]|jgi:CRISPR-associated protein Csd1|nr:type I-C CRISPR-associated protein Cas8c/Csd1 [Desulfovibrio sp.]
MSWFQKLYDTYEYCAENADLADDVLLPVSHTSQQVHIRVFLDGIGQFNRAECIGKQQMIIPATEDSAGRSSNPPPHPLIDKLHYCAGDLPEYGTNNTEKHRAYIDLLSAWVDSPFSHPKVAAVLAYIRKGTLACDLLGADILQIGTDGRLLTEAPTDNPSPLFKALTSKKEGGKSVRDQADALVCWSVEIPGDMESYLERDKGVRESWIKYDVSSMQQCALCMVTGTEQILTTKHPRNIRRPGDGAKLVSSNDTSGFTFRGKFEKAVDAVSVGYEVSHKAHNALRWLIARQGYHNGDQVVVAWAVKGVEIPALLTDIWQEGEVIPDIDASDSPIAQPVAQKVDHIRDVGQSFALQLRKILSGYEGALSPTDAIVILGLNSATPGRLSVTFYRELLWSDYLEKIGSWQLDMAWLLRRTRKKEENDKKSSVFWRICAPTPEEICLAAYGKRPDATLKKATVERLLPCIADAAPLPWDIVANSVRRACNRVGLENWEWESTLGIACALYKGFYARKPDIQQRRYNMSLEPERTSRDYLYGRLLAVAEHLESRALHLAKEERPTNAERLMQRFSDHPLSTWLVIRKNLEPYRQRLQQHRAGFLRNVDSLLDEIHTLFLPGDFESPEKLSGEFLLGYHCQRSALWKKKEENYSDIPETIKGA